MDVEDREAGRVEPKSWKSKGFRIGVRGALVAVLVAAAVMWAGVMERRRRHFLEQAAYHDTRAAEWLGRMGRNPHPDREIDDLVRVIGRMRDPRSRDAFGQALSDMRRTRDRRLAGWREALAAQGKQAEDHAARAARYRRLADHPWRSVSPEPLPPR